MGKVFIFLEKSYKNVLNYPYQYAVCYNLHFNFYNC